MATINQKIQTLISDVNGITGCSDTDLTSAIRTLAAGYGQGGGGGAQETIKLRFRDIAGCLSDLEADPIIFQTFDPTTLELKTWDVLEMTNGGDSEVESEHDWKREYIVPKGTLILYGRDNNRGVYFWESCDHAYKFGNNADPNRRECFDLSNYGCTSSGTTIFIALSDVTIDATWCLRPDALITMADGSEKRVCELSLDDKVLGYNPQGELVAQSLTYIDAKEHKTHSEYDRWLFSDGTVLETVHQHRFYNYDLRRMEYMQRWELGQHALKLDGSTPYLIAHETIKEPTEHYTLFCEYNNYFADGCLSGNRHTPELNLPNKHDELISKLLINK